LDIFFGILRIYYRTFRIVTTNESPWVDYLQQGGFVLLCGWHQQFFPTVGYFGKFKGFSPSLMISRSNDGDIGAGICRRAGWRPIRGSSTQGGLKALKSIIRELRKSRLAGHIVDGPQGPAGIVKPGAITLALAAHAVIVPVRMSADKAWFLNSWDRFMLPKPFAEVRFDFGPMIHLKTSGDKVDVEILRRDLEMVMKPYLITPC
jgi:lysophospholipid acyltransferase (LPLAT)-like uncharacterized protein